MRSSLLKVSLKSNINQILEIVTAARHSFKLSIFKSPMNEFTSISFSLYHLKAILMDKIRAKSRQKSDNIHSLEFREKGFSTFTNQIIRNNSERIMEKIKSKSDIWDETNTFIGSPSTVFKMQLVDIFRNGVDQFIKDSFKSDYYIFYHIMYRSKRLSSKEIPEGSALWHADGGPGTCMNLMICHTPVNPNNGSMKIFPWKVSKKLLTYTFKAYKRWTNFNKLSSRSTNDKTLHRAFKTGELQDHINLNSFKYFQPNTDIPGLVYAFRNNCVHAGGFAKEGYERVVSVIHIYPSSVETTIEEKFNSSHLKYDPWPKNVTY